ncbi:activator of Hsp90 ATPase 1 family protein [Amycolatopsis antarctica]|uniref:Activator of Hsp90 ATPase 1 family protein n=1 Tax=Amycolatopsis antarctica TaxID=1854586 RepID=A0A263D3L7_9PSEU|nr:SRPBCC domain-containing protein [Amycolatopsis antarctica]OZM72678.1 activator of Hsp90 ATPase 1 family protein [Amycolatopsis antarctica]
MTVGRTKDAGFQIGVSKTIPYATAEVWRFLVSPEGRTLWLGETDTWEPVRGAGYRTTEGTVGEIRGFREGDRIRLTWLPADRQRETTVQVAVSAQGDRTVLRFHQERMADAEERTRQREHWSAVMDAVVAALARRFPGR